MTIIELIKQIKPFPVLFIRKHSIFNLEVFIDGWYYRDEEEDVRASVLYKEFYEWLQEKYKVGGSGGWADILYYKFETEEKALDEFFVLFNIFYNSCGLGVCHDKRDHKVEHPKKHLIFHIFQFHYFIQNAKSFVLVCCIFKYCPLP